jgi:NADP-dependent aldehyde dehydrogenase
LSQRPRPHGAATFHAIDPATGKTLDGRFIIAGFDEVDAACAAAAAAAPIFRETAPDKRAQFLEAIAAGIDAIGERLIVRAMAETGLPRVRLEGERTRTVGQLRLFAQVARRGAWAGVTIDPSLPGRMPAPRPDLRQRRLAIGPVAVFGASNFPLAFSVAGGDTAAALAAGCPVVAKGHPAHPGVSAMVAEAVDAAVRISALPTGVFALLQGPSHELGAALVADARIHAVGFTGSRAGGLALMEVARRRAHPIPVHAEMSSINPVLLLPHALSARAEMLGEGFVGSLTLGAGQFCTNPGLIVAIDGPDLARFIGAAAGALAAARPQVMLSPAIHDHYQAGVDALVAHPAVETIALGVAADAPNRARPALFATDAARFLGDVRLGAEVFGPASLIVRCRDAGDMAAVIDQMEGQLTITLQLDAGDEALARELLPSLEDRAGRILANGWPTGVEVAAAMVHGGPFPATSDGRSTSVGTAAIERFLRPVCYQNLPETLLPEVLLRANPLGVPQRIDGAPD